MLLAKFCKVNRQAASLSVFRFSLLNARAKTSTTKAAESTRLPHLLDTLWQSWGNLTRRRWWPPSRRPLQRLLMSQVSTELTSLLHRFCWAPLEMPCCQTFYIIQKKTWKKGFLRHAESIIPLQQFTLPWSLLIISMLLDLVYKILQKDPLFILFVN